MSGGVAAQGDAVPFEDLFPNGTPDNFVSMTVEFDKDTVDDGGADTTSDFPDDHNEEDEPFGALFLDSPKDSAMADLSEQSDWVLTACNPRSLERQTVFAFCSKTMSGSSCAQVFKGAAEHTIVKMPKGCGKGPLARVHSLAVHDGLQALTPADLAKKPASEPVYKLVFDYDFAAIPADNGPVYMRADVADIPGYWDAIVDSPTEAGEKRRRRRRAIQERGFWSKLKDWAAKITTVSERKNDRRKFEFKNTITLFNQSTDCGAFKGNLFASVTARAAFNTEYGFYFEGTLVPPNINQAFVFFNGDAVAGGDFTIKGVATVNYDSKRVPLGTFAFPGLSVPGVVAVGPALVLEGYISGGITVNGSLTASLDYAFPPVNFAVGPGSNVVSSAVQPVSPPTSQVTTSLTAGVAISANAAVHLVPSVQLGISLVGGKLLDAQAYVEADLFAGIGLNSTVSTTQPFTVCVNPFFGVDLDAGVKGQVAFWKGQVGPFPFYKNQFSIASRCFAPGSAIAPPSNSHTHRGLEEAYGGASGGIGKRELIPGSISCPKKA